MSAAVIVCAEPGCGNAITVDPGHVANLEATPWRCAIHANEEEI